MTELKSIYLEGLDPSTPLVIAGPCSAESRDQVLDTAKRLAKAGIRVFRAGVWKPRTKPGCFEGIGLEALEWLAEVKNKTGMYTATEVANRAHVEAAVEAGVDILWIGTRTSTNPFAMQEIADTLKYLNTEIPVLVKNPITPDLELWIGAMERLYNAGVRRLGAIHRGFNEYGNQLYRNQPQWNIPIELRRRYPHLPIICDPSHMGGRRELIGPISQQALDMGFNGLIIESHCNPDCALSDKNQQVTPEALEVILSSLVVRNQNAGAENLSSLRRKIDTIDNELVEALAKRMQVSREIGEYKKEHKMPVLQTGRYDDILRSRVNMAVEMGLSADFMTTILKAIHEESVRQQIEIVKREGGF